MTNLNKQTLNELRNGDWIQTFTGGQFWPLDPRPEDVHIEDIAHALSMLCRYGGHSRRFYSVAEHCCILHDYAPHKFKSWALMHDASEAYIVDVPRPLKPYLTGYKAAERVVMDAVCVRFGLAVAEPPEVKEIDGRILADEAAQNMAAPPVPWPFHGEPLGVTLHFWSPNEAEAQFLARAGKVGLTGIPSNGRFEQERTQ